MRHHVVLAAFLATTGVAMAQAAATYDPAQLPATKGVVAAYSLTPRGDVDGLILTDGTEVHLPPHLGAQLVFAVKPGCTICRRPAISSRTPTIQNTDHLATTGTIDATVCGGACVLASVTIDASGRMNIKQATMA